MTEMIEIEYEFGRRKPRAGKSREQTDRKPADHATASRNFRTNRWKALRAAYDALAAQNERVTAIGTDIAGLFQRLETAVAGGRVKVSLVDDARKPLAALTEAARGSVAEAVAIVEAAVARVNVVGVDAENLEAAFAHMEPKRRAKYAYRARRGQAANAMLDTLPSIVPGFAEQVAEAGSFMRGVLAAADGRVKVSTLRELAEQYAALVSRASGILSELTNGVVAAGMTTDINVLGSLPTPGGKSKGRPKGSGKANPAAEREAA